MSRILFLLAFAVLQMATPSVFAQVNFHEQVINSGDTSSYGIAGGDFNNDGILDLITINTSTLSFYKGQINGTFANPLNQSISPNLGQVMAADFNRDGKLDLAVVPARGASGGLTIFLGNGDGTFRQGAYMPLPGTFSFLTLADFNGDHLPDIAVSDGSNTSPGVRVFLGQGDGTFRLSSTLDDGGWQLVSGDFNADGHQDLAVIASDEQHVALYLGKGDGSFQSPVVAQVPTLVEWLGVGDFYNNRVQSLVGDFSEYNGNGTYTTHVFTLRYANGQLLVENNRVLSNTVLAALEEIQGGDLNGDFKEDAFLTAGFGGGLSDYVIGNGDGTFQGPFQAPYVGYQQLQYLVRDLNGDSRHDVAVAFTDGFQGTGGVDILLNSSAVPNCPLPRGRLFSTLSLALHICAPMNGQIVGQTFTFEGSGIAFNGIAKRMELWIDGRKVAQNLEDQLKATVTLSRGRHVASFVVVNTFDEYADGSISFTAQY